MAAALPSGGYDPVEVKAQARAWVDGVNSASGVSGGWRLQVLRLRTRRKFDGASAGSVTDVNGDAVSSEGARAPDGGCDELPARIRRFVPGCPWALVDQAVRYLYEIAPYTGIVYNGVRVEGKYRPTLTQWVRDDQATVGERGANGTYTLIQDLIEVADCDDSLTVATGASCSAYEETTFKWDADSVEPLPVECEQGVTWSIRAVSRSEEDGTYSYQLVKTVARTRHYGPALVECGPQAEVTEESWESAYGEPGAFEARGCGADGPIETPPCDTKPGIKTQVQYRMNPDCTFDVVVRRRESKEFSDSWRDGTACRPQDVTVARNARSMPATPVPAVGERVDRKLQRNEDDTYDVTDTVVRAVEPYEYSWTDGSPCRERTVDVRRAQTSMPVVPAVRAGETLEADVQRNEDCTWDARFSVTKSPEAFVRAWTEGSACRPANVRVAQNEAAAPEIPSPGPGETVSMTLSRNADCTYDSRIQVVRPAPESTISWSDGSPCRPAEHKAWQGWTSVPSVEARARGKMVSASLRRNDDCTYDGTQEVVQTVPSQVSWSEGSPCRPVAAKAAWGQSAVDVTLPEQGKTVSASVSRNADCTYDVTEKVVSSPEPSTIRWTDGSCAQETAHVLHENALSVVDPGVGEQGAVTRASFRRNEDCTYSGEVAVTTSAEGSQTWQEGVSCRPTTAVASWNQKNVSIPQIPDGGTVSASVSRNADCTYDVLSKVTPQMPSDDQTWTDGSCSQSTEHRVLDHVAEVVDPGVGEQGAVTRASFRRNEDCTYSGEVAVTKSMSDSQTWTEGVSCRPTTATVSWNQKSVSIPEIPEGGTVSASVSRNADCTYDVLSKVTPPVDSAEDEWTGGSPCEPVRTTAYFHHRGLPPVPESGKGKFVRASFRRNDDCTYSGDVDVVESAPDSQSWTDGGACAPAAHHVLFNQKTVNIPAPAAGQTVSASVSKNHDCTYNYQYAVRTAQSRVDRHTWESEEQHPQYVYTYSHELVLFSHVTELPEIPQHSSVGVSVQVNDDCTYSGSISSKKLKNWRLADSDEGGIGRGYFERKVKAIVNGVTKTRTMRYQTTVYKGSGNASASTLARHQSVSGVAGATVAVDLVDEGEWVRDE